MANRLLIIGSSVTEGKPETIGGANILFGKLKTYLDSRPDVQSLFIKANLFDSQVRSMVHILKELVSLRRKYDLIFLNVSQNGIVILFPIISSLALLLGKKVAMRAFGASALDDLNRCKWKPWLKWSFRRSELVAMETHFLVDAFKDYSEKVYWLPNVREEVPNAFEKPKTYSKRFLFVAHVKQSKGILEAIKAFEALDDSYTFHFYGPIVDSELEHLNAHLWYKGKLEPDQVTSTLGQYDAIVLPTYYDGEGYPGIIIEAYQAGLFCVTTNWRNVPEIVEEGKTGYLLPIKDSVALAECIQSVSESSFQAMRTYIKEYRKSFETKNVHKALVDKLLNAGL